MGLLQEKWVREIYDLGLLPKLQVCGRTSQSMKCFMAAGEFVARSDLQSQCLQKIQESKIIACLRATSSQSALEAARAALDGGVAVLEVTMTTPGVTEVISKLIHEYPSALIGAGTVLSVEQATMAKDAGARFLLSPITVKELVEIHANGPVLFIPGAMTPTEVFTAHSYGARIVKIYPTDLAGGVKYVQSLRKLLQQVPVIASQGITLEMIQPYILAGASAVVLSNAIFDVGLSLIKQRALAATKEMQSGRSTRLFLSQS